MDAFEKLTGLPEEIKELKSENERLMKKLDELRSKLDLTKLLDGMDISSEAEAHAYRTEIEKFSLEDLREECFRQHLSRILDSIASYTTGAVEQGRSDIAASDTEAFRREAALEILLSWNAPLDAGESFWKTAASCAVALADALIEALRRK